MTKLCSLYDIIYIGVGDRCWRQKTNWWHVKDIDGGWTSNFKSLILLWHQHYFGWNRKNEENINSPFMVSKLDFLAKIFHEFVEFLGSISIWKNFIFVSLALFLKENCEFMIFSHVCMFVKSEDSLPGIYTHYWVESCCLYIQIWNNWLCPI